MLGRISPIPIVLRSKETTDEYEADFLRRITPHPDAMEERSQRINFATGVLEISWVVIYPQLILATPLLLVRLDLAKEVQLVLLLIGGHQPRYVDA